MSDYVRVAEVMKSPNYFWSNWRSILGRNTSWSHRLDYSNDFIANIAWLRCSINVMLGGPSSGKSGIWKAGLDQSIAIRCIHYGKATGIVFDGVGRDGPLLKFPGAEGFIFEKEGMFRHGHPNVIAMTPWFLKRDAAKDDLLFAIPWTELHFDEWDYLLSQMGDAKAWSYQLKRLLIDRQKEIRSLAWLAEEFERKAMNKHYSSSIIPKLLPDLAVAAVARALVSIVDQGYLTEPGDPRNYYVVDLMEKGWIPVIKYFNNSAPQTKLYTGILSRQVYDYYDNKANYYESIGFDRWVGPFMVYEEFSSIVSKQKLGDPLTPAEIVVEDVIKKAQKNRFELWLVLQDSKDVPGEIRRSLGTHRVFVRNPTPEDYLLLDAKFGKIVMSNGDKIDASDIVRSLSSQPEASGAREWALFDGGTPITFWQVGAMSKLHVR